jgi:hypothetical protein
MPRVPRRPPARPTAAEEAEAVASRRMRAAEEPLDVRLRSAQPFVQLEVRNPVHRTSYRVLVPAYPSLEAAICTCTDFARRGLGTCKHLEAARAWLGEHPELPSAPPATAEPPNAEALWSAVERGLAQLALHEPESIRALERAGRALIDAPREEKGRGEKVGRSANERSRPTPTSRARP